MSSAQEPAGGWSISVRAEAFSDGVFAIVITLLVLTHVSGRRCDRERHPELTEGQVDDAFSGCERHRAQAGVLGYAVGGVLGALVLPPIGLAVFIILPIYYGVTSHGRAPRRSSPHASI